MKRNQKIGLVLTLILGLIVCLNYKKLGVNPLEPVTVDTPSMVLNQTDGGKIVTDRSGKRFYKVNADGTIAFAASGDRNSKEFYEVKQMVTDGDGSIYLLDVHRSGSRKVELERILKYSPDGTYEACITEISYGETDLVYKNRINRLAILDGKLAWFQFTDGGFSLMSQEGENEFFPYEDAENLLVDFAVNPVDQSFSYLTKTGDIFTRNESGDFKRIYSVEGKEGHWIPWYMSYGKDGELYCADIGKRAVCRIEEGQEISLVMTNYSNEYTEIPSAEEIRSYPIFYTLDMGEQLLTTDGYGVVAAPVEETGIGEVIYETEYPLSMSLRVISALVWGAAVLLALLLLLGAFLGIVHLMKSENGNAKIVAGLLLATVVIIALFSMIILRDWNNRMTEEMTKRTQSVSGLAAQLIPGDSMKEIDSIGDYVSDEYQEIRHIMRSMFVTDNASMDDLYCTIYRIQDGMITAMYTIEDYVGAVYPYDWPFEDSDEQWMLENKEQLTYTGLAASEGSFIFTNSPILDSEGNAVGILEVGTSLYSFQQENRQVIVEIVISALAIAVAGIFIVFELLVFGSGFRKLGKGWRSFNALRGREIPADVLRLLVFVIFFATNMPKGFLPIYIINAAKTEEVFGLSPAMLVSIALSAEVFFGALLSFGGNFVIHRMGRRRAALFGSFLFAGGLSIRALIPTIVSFIAGNAVMGAGWGILLLIVQIMIAEKNEEEKADGFTGYTAASLSGMNCGVVFGAFLVNWLSHRAVLSVIGLISCTTLLFSYIFIYDGANDRVKTEKKKEGQMSPLRFIFSPRVFFYFIGIVIPVVAAGYFLAYLYPLMGEEFGISETNIGYSYLLNGICIVFLGAALTKMLMRKISKKGILVTAALLYAAAFFLVSAYPGVLTLLASLILLGISDSYGLPMQSTYYTDLPEVQRYGYDRAMGMYSLFENMSQVLGSFLFGIIYVNGIGTGLFYAGIVLLVLAALFYLTGRKNAKGEKYGDSF